MVCNNITCISIKFHVLLINCVINNISSFIKMDKKVPATEIKKYANQEDNALHKVLKP